MLPPLVFFPHCPLRGGGAMPENLCPERAQKTRPERAKPATWSGIKLHPERANLQPGARLGGCSIPGRVVLTRAGYASNSPQIYSISFFPSCQRSRWLASGLPTLAVGSCLRLKWASTWRNINSTNGALMGLKWALLRSTRLYLLAKFCLLLPSFYSACPSG